MESVFGEPPSNSNLSPTNDISVVQKPHFIPPQIGENVQGLTHISISSSGEAQMVDISSKESSKRVAIASSKVILGKKVFDLVSANQIAKGDVLSVARIAGISGAKQTSNGSFPTRPCILEFVNKQQWIIPNSSLIMVSWKSAEV
ncbi:hypothetical protein IFM89_029489 [Coptis chinensis]|uniref:Molybdopterin cofactor biosynthesis C (MoaC) domain-containing protein n=1 Tax=Coptis chinensis TaxID=261450 RepID=A0A835HTX2_9MAGN|nr:hypothetical protein IFM89_029489 [Coptis chinensis]